MNSLKKYITLVDFHTCGYSERWNLDNIPNKGDAITIKGRTKIVDSIHYHFDKENNSCNIFIKTENI